MPIDAQLATEGLANARSWIMEAAANGCSLSPRHILHQIEVALAGTELAAPIPMVLYCPNRSCGAQHIDAPEESSGWENPPHKSHLCHACGFIWRPADVPTTGVAALTTRGTSDSVPVTIDGGGEPAQAALSEST